MAKPSENWDESISALPPGLSAAEVARLLKKPFATVYKNLILYGYPRSNGRHRHRQPGSASWARVEWAQVDWSQSNAALAQTYSVSQQAVHEMRKRLGLPPSIRYTPSASAAPRVKKKPGKKPKWPESVWKKVDWRRQSEDIAAAIGCSGNYVSQMRRRYAPETLFQPRVPASTWRKVDWNKTNAQIASELGKGMDVHHVGYKRSQLRDIRTRGVRWIGGGSTGGKRTRLSLQSFVAIRVT